MLSGPSHANKTETSLISTKMDHGCLPRSPELCETFLPAEGWITHKTKEAEGIHPGFTYNALLPVPWRQSYNIPPVPVQHLRSQGLAAAVKG